MIVDIYKSPYILFILKIFKKNIFHFMNYFSSPMSVLLEGIEGIIIGIGD